jgi:ATP-binding cassette, subfamily A (ABC1), member 3
MLTVLACPQFDALDDAMTTSEHLKFYARMKGVAELEQERNVQIILDKTGLRGYEQSLALKLSGGNQRKLSLAIALLGA